MNDGAAFERSLRDAVRRGDEGAWRLLHREHEADVRARSLRAAHGRVELGEEIAQETWAVAVRRIADFDPERGRFGAWLGGICARVAHECRRRDGNGATSSLRHDPAHERPDDASEEIALVLGELPASWRQALEDKYRHGKSVAEIAARLGETEKAVESRLTRARREFRRRWSRRLETHDEERT